jgi:hypothetical protein
MVKHVDTMNAERKIARSKADFIRLSGIGPELAEFLTAFNQSPEIFYSMPFGRRREIENQMDVVLFSFEKL